ncbi:MAG: nitronate monooxygenase [Candidatus Kerfeldbacteria bacterium]
MPLIFALYGMLLAHGNYLFIGAGIATQISGILDQLLKHNPATYEIHVIGAKNTKKFLMKFNPREFMHCPLPKLKRPYFFPIISSAVIAQAMTRSNDQKIDGWVEEASDAGGHSMNPRGKVILTDDGQPIYGKRDEFDYQLLRDIGLPFYRAGACASPEALAQAQSLGAIGIQVGTIFSLCDISGINTIICNYIRKEAYNRRLIIFNDPRISPTGFTFKVARIPGTIGDSTIYTLRRRICDIGGLIQPYLRDNGTVGYRCPAEPEKAYVFKEGRIEDTIGRGCLCNGLFSTVDLGQRLLQGLLEPPIVTQGQNLDFLQHLMHNEDDDYTVDDVFNYLLSRCSI